MIITNSANMKNVNKGFTIVELLTVTVIMAILWTISFVAYNSYSSSARDTGRLEDISNMKANMNNEIQRMWYLNMPSNPFFLTNQWKTVVYQWKIDEAVKVNWLRWIKRDPLSDKYYWYSLTYWKNLFQLGITLENSWNPMALIDWNYHPLSINLLPSLFVALSGSWKAEISSGSESQSLFILNGWTYNLLYDFNWHEMLDWWKALWFSWIINEKSVEISVNSIYKSCQEIYEVWRYIWPWEYTIQSSTWAQVPIECGDSVIPEYNYSSLNDSSLVWYWDMETLTEDWKLKDLSWNGNNCSFSWNILPTKTQARNWKWLYFSSWFLDCWSSLYFNNNITLVAYVRPDSFDNPYPRIMDKNWEYLLALCDYAPNLISWFGANYYSLSGSIYLNPYSTNNTIALNNYYHLASTLNNQTSKLYLNWIESATNPATISNNLSFTGIANRWSNLLIWNNNTWMRSFVWIIDELRIYNRVLSDNEIKTLYNNDNTNTNTIPAAYIPWNTYPLWSSFSYILPSWNTVSVNVTGTWYWVVPGTKNLHTPNCDTDDVVIFTGSLLQVWATCNAWANTTWNPIVHWWSWTLMSSILYWSDTEDNRRLAYSWVYNSPTNFIWNYYQWWRNDPVSVIATWSTRYVGNYETWWVTLNTTATFIISGVPPYTWVNTAEHYSSSWVIWTDLTHNWPCTTWYHIPTWWTDDTTTDWWKAYIIASNNLFTCTQTNQYDRLRCLLHIPLAWDRSTNWYNWQWLQLNYWSSKPSLADLWLPYAPYFASGTGSIVSGTRWRAAGLPVRCLKN